MSTKQHPRTEATYDDVLALPDHVVGEIVDGELIVSPRPAVPAATAENPRPRAPMVPGSFELLVVSPE